MEPEGDIQSTADKRPFYIVKAQAFKAKRIIAKILETHPNLELVHTKQYAGYIFIRADTCKLNELFEISKMPGVLSVFQFKGKPIKSNIQPQQLTEKVPVEHEIQIGDEVRVTGGSFKDSEGTVQQIKGNEVQVGVFFLGRITSILILTSQISKKN